MRLTCFFLAHGDVLMDRIPRHVRVLPENPILRAFDLPCRPGVWYALCQGMPRVACARLLVPLRRMFCRDTGAKEHVWQWIALLPVQYDAAIGYCEGATHRFVALKTSAVRKIGWVPLDYSRCSIDVAWERQTSRVLDSLVTVSENCRQVLISMLGLAPEKVSVVHNLVNAAEIRQLAAETVQDLNLMEGVPYLVSVGRVCQQKGYDLALEACRLLILAGCPVIWDIIGDGHDAEVLRRKASTYGLEDSFRLRGSRGNPYPYMKACTVYVQPSRFEAWGLTVSEAKVLGKPMVVSDIPEFREQVTDMQNGMVAPLNPEDLASGIKRLLQDDALRRRFTAALDGYTGVGVDELHKFDLAVSGS